VLFAPVYFPRSVYEQPGFTFSAGIVIDIGSLQFSLFTCPRYCHYYFGDYFDDFYIGIGIYPRFECEQRHIWYDPIYEYDRWHFRKTDPRWEEHQRNEYDLRRANKDLRPARTYHEMETRLARLPEPQRRNIQIAKPMSEFVAAKTTSMKFEHINNDARSKFATQATDVHKFRQDRSRWESPEAGQKTVQPPTEHKGPVTQSVDHIEPVSPTAEGKPAFAPPREVKRTQAEKVTIPKSPIANKRGLLSIFEKGPPSRPADEQKVDVRDTHKDTETRRDTDTHKGTDTRHR
jgi:hypothetical protein